jgi:uncharacterized protein (TIGR02996 family)
MTHADAFLQHILECPNDDAPRLIYADWLEEQGDAESIARAEFIRVQCALAGENVPPHRRTELEWRKRKILEHYNAEWARSIRRLVRTWNYHRGFVDDVTLSPRRFLAHAGQLFRRTPIQHLHLWPRFRPTPPRITKSINMAALADNKYLSNLRSLDLRENLLESQDVRALVVSEYLTSLTTLNLSHNRIGDSGIRALAASPLLGRLEYLNLRYNDIGANGLRALAHALDELVRIPEGLRLQRLELYSPNLSAAAKRVLAESPQMRRLVRG